MALPTLSHLTHLVKVTVSVWLWLVFWIGVFWLGGLAAVVLDRRWQMVSFAPVWLQWLGLVLTVLGLTLVFFSAYALVNEGGGSPNPWLRPPASLVTRGVYRSVRHPMFLGFIALAFGYGLLLDSLTFTVIVAPAILVGVTLRSRQEEHQLRRTFGPAYEHYQQITRAFLPRFRGPRP